MRIQPRTSPERILAARALADEVLRPPEPRTFRSAAKATPSPDDLQDHLDRAHNAVVQAGAMCAQSKQRRGAEGRRNSHEDQAWLNSAHKHLVAAGAACPSASDADADAEPAAAEAWRDHFDRALDLPVPDAYAPHLDARREANGTAILSADLDPRYKPLGQPPDGYAIALAARRMQQDARAAATPTRTTEPRVDLHRDANGTPDPYAAGLAARRAR